MTSLFAMPDDTPAPAGYAGIAIEQAVDRVLDYAIPLPFADLLRVGQRVLVPLGRNNKPAHGYVVSIAPTTRVAATKPILDVDDARVLIDSRLMSLARWIAKYYVCPLGQVLDSIIPAAVKRRVGQTYRTMVFLDIPPQQLADLIAATKAPKRRALLGRLSLLAPGTGVDLLSIAGEAGVKPATVRKLVDMKVIRIAAQAMEYLESAGPEVPAVRADAVWHALNGEQQAAVDAMHGRIADGFSVTLLQGVTGSGKTEVYLQVIRRVVDSGRQAVVMVPEIALTPQTVRRFTERFGHVAVMHSGLGSTERHRQWQAVAAGRANVVVGARSAIFAPVPRLGILVVDEEHEASYKQDSAPRYHGRDVAIKRAQMENVPVLLGSATPSLELWHRVHAPPAVAAPDAPAPPRYYLQRLTHRVGHHPMPHVELVDQKHERKLRPGIHLIGSRLESLMRSTLDAGRQVILLLNRRGYSNFVYCASCQTPLGCKYCDTTMTYHRAAGATEHDARASKSTHTGTLHCHYCLAVNTLPPTCPTCGKKLILFGLGTQRVEEELVRKFPGLAYARVDSDTMRDSRDYEALLARFAAGEVKVMLGTQMIAKGLDYPNVTLVGVISGDTALSLPDFRAAERTFQLITQVAGRAGRGEHLGRVILQTFQPDDPTIQAALKHDYDTFANRELKHRTEVGLPPTTRMVRIIIRDDDETAVQKRAENVAAALADPVTAAGNLVRLRGPMPCAITRIAGFFSHQIVLTSPRADVLQTILAAAREKGALAKGDRIATDVDPMSLL